MHLVCIYDYITVLQFCVGFLLELPSNFCGDFLLESSKVPTTKKRPALPVEMRGALVIIQAYASGWGCAAEDWAAMNSAASSGMSSKSSSLPISTLSGGFLNRISYRIGTIYRVIRVA